MVMNSIGRLENQEYQDQLSLPARNCMEQRRTKSERGALITALLLYSGFWRSTCMDSLNSFMISERNGLSFLKMIEVKLTIPSQPVFFRCLCRIRSLFVYTIQRKRIHHYKAKKFLASLPVRCLYVSFIVFSKEARHSRFFVFAAWNLARASLVVIFSFIISFYFCKDKKICWLSAVKR